MPQHDQEQDKIEPGESDRITGRDVEASRVQLNDEDVNGPRPGELDEEEVWRPSDEADGQDVPSPEELRGE